jgi:hypothetical protein
MLYDDFPNYFYPRMPMYPMMPGTPYRPMPNPTPEPTPEPTPPITTLPPDFVIEPGPPVQTDINYTQGYLQSQIGKYVKIDFLVGTNLYIDKEGILKDVGISYVILQEPNTDNLLLADIYSIKFVEIFE